MHTRFECRKVLPEQSTMFNGKLKMKQTHVMTAASVMNWLLALLSLRSLSILMATFFPSYSPNHTSVGGRQMKSGVE